MFGIEKDFQNLMEQVYGPLNGGKMTDEIDPSRILKDNDCIWYMGEKYQKVQEPQSFYNKLWEVLKSKIGDNVDTDETADRIFDLIKDTIPKPYDGIGLSEYFLGYNECIRKIEENLK